MPCSWNVLAQDLVFCCCCCLFVSEERELYASHCIHLQGMFCKIFWAMWFDSWKRMGPISPRIREYFVLFLRVGLHPTGLSSTMCQAAWKGRAGFSRLDWNPWPWRQGSAHHFPWTGTASPFGCHANAVLARELWLGNQPLVLALEYDQKNTKKQKKNKKTSKKQNKTHQKTTITKTPEFI